MVGSMAVQVQPEDTFLLGFRYFNKNKKILWIDEPKWRDFIADLPNLRLGTCSHQTSTMF